MALEDLTGTNKYISSLNPSWPTDDDFLDEGDNHVRGIKNVLKNTFTGATGPVDLSLAPFVPVAQKGIASGVASLDAGGKVPVAQLPAVASGTVILAPVVLSGQTFVDFAIPAGVRRIYIGLLGLQANGNAAPMVQIGDAGGIETSGYTGAAALIVQPTNIYTKNFTNGFLIPPVHNAGCVYVGGVELHYTSPGNWQMAGNVGRFDAGALVLTGGNKGLSADPLTTVRVTTEAGTDPLNAGQINVSYGF